jgi:hypothetical protein
LAKARIATNKKAANTRALLEAVPRELHGDPGFIFSRIQLLRREEKFAEAAQLMLGAPKDANRLHNLDEWWIERRLLARKMLDVGEHRTAYLIARDAALPSRDIYKTEQEFTAGWIALRFLNDPQVAAQHFGGAAGQRQRDPVDQRAHRGHHRHAEYQRGEDGEQVTGKEFAAQGARGMRDHVHADTPAALSTNRPPSSR